MMKYRVRFIVFIGIALLQPLVWGNDNHGIKPAKLSYHAVSCTDRCHVNYLAYHTVYHGEVFRHKTHSPQQGLECSRCHNNDAVNTKTHGNLIIQHKDCWGCHHKKDDETITNPLFTKDNENVLNSPGRRSFDEKGCLNCHADVQDYINGDIQSTGIKMPDWMYKAVSCTDCHKPASDGLSFKAVREYCIECHNDDYGLLYDAWKETLNHKIKQLCENDRNTIPMRNLLKLVQSYGMHNIRLSQKFLMNHD
ncbi:MAG: cytochrome c3 family protein [Candidatus Brocadia sp.]|nr:cytochrome c3 family protein [Candidatus Brocadia sp.]